ncbi:MAG: DUF3276 family protein [Fimbriimonadaceae bacterium]|nr:DUF3276 family protein [Chitinophagales bacterium]
MEQDNRNRNESVFSRKIRAGRRRTYFFDVRTTRSNDYYLTITESKKRHDGDGYERHKVFLYKEDFNKFLAETEEVINFIKSKMPDFDFDAYNHVYENQEQGQTETHKTDTQEADTDTQDTSETQTEEMQHEEPTDEQESDDAPQTKQHDDDDDLKM